MGRGRLVRALVGVAGAVVVGAVALFSSPSEDRRLQVRFAAPFAAAGGAGDASPAPAVGRARPHRTPALRMIEPGPPDRHRDAEPEESHAPLPPPVDDGRGDGALRTRQNPRAGAVRRRNFPVNLIVGRR